MKKIVFTLTTFTAAVLIMGSAFGSESQNLAACVAGNDWDQDGKLNADDVTPDDSCSATSTGLEDCSTGAGDGIPDCDSTGL